MLTNSLFTDYVCSVTSGKLPAIMIGLSQSYFSTPDPDTVASA